MTSAIDADDAAFWNVASSTDVLPMSLVPPHSSDPLVLVGQQLGATITTFTEEITPLPQSVELFSRDQPHQSQDASSTLLIALTGKLNPVSRLSQDRQARVLARLVHVLEQGVPHPTDGALKLCEGVYHPDFAQYSVHAEALTRWIAKYLRAEKALDPEQIPVFANELVDLARPLQTPKPILTGLAPTKGKPAAKLKRSKPDLNAIPESGTTQALSVPIQIPTPRSATTQASRQLLLFPLPQAYA